MTTIEDLETFFSKAALPATIQLGPGELITDVKTFVHSHIGILRMHGMKPTYQAFYSRLVKLKDLLEAESK